MCTDAGEFPRQSLDFPVVRVENRAGRGRRGGNCIVARRHCTVGHGLQHVGWAGE